MSGRDELPRDFPNCKCDGFTYWWGEFYIPGGFKAKVFFNPQKILENIRAKIPVVTYMSKTSWRVPTIDELRVIENIQCHVCGHKATEEELNLIKEVAHLKIEHSRRITP